MSGAELASVGAMPVQLGTGTLKRRRDERGMISAEWAVGILAASAIAGVLLAVVTNGGVQDALLKFILFVINSFSGLMVKG